MSTRADQFLARYDALDRVLVENGFPATSPWWRKEIARFIRSGKRRWIIIAGMLAGQSSTLCRISVAVALWGEWSVPPGDRANIPFVSVDRSEASARLRTIGSNLRALRVNFDERGEELELHDRPLVFRVVSATIKGVVGFTSVLVIADEQARWESRDDRANPAPEVMANLRPTMASIPTAFEIDCSSPWGTDDFHAVQFDRGDDANQLTSFAPTWVANPTISEHQTKELEPDERLWIREYGAEPGVTLTAALDLDDVKIAFGRKPRGAKTKHAFLAIDSSSLRGDAFTWIAGYESSERELVVDDVGGWDGPALKRVSLDQIAEKLAKKAKSIGAPKIFGDHFEQAGIKSALARGGVSFHPFHWSDESKDGAVMSIRRFLREGKLCLCEHADLKRELCGLKARLLPSGKTKYQTTGEDYASALISLFHAEQAAELFRHTDWDTVRRANERLGNNMGRGGSGGSPFEPPIGESGTQFRWGNSPGRGFG